MIKADAYIPADSRDAIERIRDVIDKVSAPEHKVFILWLWQIEIRRTSYRVGLSVGFILGGLFVMALHGVAG